MAHLYATLACNYVTPNLQIISGATILQTELTFPQFWKDKQLLVINKL